MFSDMFYRVTFSCVTLVRKLQWTSDLDHLHACDLLYSHVKSRDDPISDCRGDQWSNYVRLGEAIASGCQAAGGALSRQIIIFALYLNFLKTPFGQITESTVRPLSG